MGDSIFGSGLLELVQIGLGVFLLFCAITGKGKIYKNDYIKEGYEEKHFKVTRIWLFLISPITMLGGLINLLKWDTTGGILSGIVWGMVLVGFVGYLIISSRMTDRTKNIQAENIPHKHPAFDFDDEDAPKVDEDVPQ